MKLKDLLLGVKTRSITGPQDIQCMDVCIDSRNVAAGSVFVALIGSQSDAHNFIPDVIQRGASVVVCSQLPSVLPESVCFVCVEDTHEALGWISSNWYGRPSDKLTLVGVTGTNGKTTIATLLYDLFRALGHRVGLLSTVCNYVDGQVFPSTHTTPDALSLNALLAKMLQAGCSHVFMEVSSHAAEQRRIAGLSFDGGIFTNITRDHLDYHGTFERYLAAKKRFFDDLPKNAFAITNADDRNGKIVLQNTKASRYDYSTQRMADFRAKVLENHLEGMMLEINKKEVSVQFIGRFNVSNLLAIYAAACLLGQDPDAVLLTMSMLKPVSGRLEFMQSPTGFISIVDYAHTPDALRNVLETLNDLVEGKGRVITVVGAGGNRDKGKRPLMAQEALNGSYRVVLTSDNPRFEEPQDILNDMLAGVPVGNRPHVLVIADRREAIRTACMLAQTGDAVLVAGKGHEDYQEIKGVKYPFDDKKVIAEIYSALNPTTC